VICIVFGLPLESPSLTIITILFSVIFINLCREQKGISKETMSYRNAVNHKLLERGLPPGTSCCVVWQKFIDISKALSPIAGLMNKPSKQKTAAVYVVTAMRISFSLIQLRFDAKSWTSYQGPYLLRSQFHT
jgi:hypothetical protein